MALPSFIIAGAQKCGTTSLAQTLRRHPQVLVSSPKEIHFFDRKFDKGVDWYDAQFPAQPKHLQVGESTPSYMYLDEARERMIATLPDARMVVILRDPVKRAYSHYWHQRRRENEPVDTFEAALAAEPERKELHFGRYAYADRGHYIDQIEALERGYGRDRLHVMLLDDLVGDRTAALQGVLTFLDLDPETVHDLPVKWTNRYRVMPAKEGEKAQPAEYPPILPETRAALVEQFRDSNERLAQWLGRDLSSWNKV